MDDHNDFLMSKTAEHSIYLLPLALYHLNPIHHLGIEIDQQFETTLLQSPVMRRRRRINATIMVA